MTAPNSAAARAAQIRARARRGVWRRLLSAAGVRTAEMQQADNLAAQWEHGAKGEEATVRLLRALNGPWWRRWLRRALGRPGWVIRHDMRLLNRKFNLDHVLVSPCGTAVVVLDTKAWRRTWPTALVRGRVRCGDEDRHDQVEKVAGYAQALEAALNMPGVVVWPLLVIHGSPVSGGRLEAPVPCGMVHVLGTDWLVSTLAAAPKVRDSRRAAVLAARVDQVLRPYS